MAFSNVDRAKLLAAALLLVVLLLIIYEKERFATRREKATSIYSWFMGTPSKSYAKYKRDLGGKSNIVEYDDVMKLFKEKDLTVESVESVI